MPARGLLIMLIQGVRSGSHVVSPRTVRPVPPDSGGCFTRAGQPWILRFAVAFS